MQKHIIKYIYVLMENTTCISMTNTNLRTCMHLHAQTCARMDMYTHARNRLKQSKTIQCFYPTGSPRISDSIKYFQSKF